MITFRKLAVAGPGRGRLLRRYFTEDTPEAERTSPGNRVTWRTDLPVEIALLLGIDARRAPRDEEIDRLFEGRHTQTGEPWSKQTLDIAGFDLTVSPHVSVTLAAEFAQAAEETAAIWDVIGDANDETMRQVAEGLFGSVAVGWTSFRNRVARPTVALKDGRQGPTYPMHLQVESKPRAHIHNILFNLIVSDIGEVGLLDTARLQGRLNGIDGYFQARLADGLRRLGVEIGLNADESEVVIPAIPPKALKAFSADWIESGEVWISEDGAIANKPDASGGGLLS